MAVSGGRRSRRTRPAGPGCASTLDLLRERIAAAFGDDPRSPVTDQLARFALAAIDGAFVASQTDTGATLERLLQPLTPSLVASRRALLAKTD